jgi:hypothetical protein
MQGTVAFLIRYKVPGKRTEFRLSLQSESAESLHRIHSKGHTRAPAASGSRMYRAAWQKFVYYQKLMTNPMRELSLGLIHRW